MYSLAFRQALTATMLGVTLGAGVLAPMAMFGPLNGRIVGSLLSLLTAVAFFCISVWSSGDAVIGAAQRVLNVHESELAFAIAYGVFAATVLIVCIYGFQLMLLINKIVVVASSTLFLVGVAAFWREFDVNFAGAGFAWGTARFWPAFIGATLVVLANPISFGAFLGDWTRYLLRDTSRQALIGGSILAQLLSLLPFFFGLVTTSIIVRHAPHYLERVTYAGGLLAVTPAWFFTPLLLLAVLSGISTGTTSLYGTGLGLSSVFPRLSRPQATLLIGLLSCGLVFVARFYFNLFDSITTFISLIVVTTTPWIVVMEIGFIVRRGYYLPEALQVFNRGQTGGPYWFHRGWNLPAMSAWILSAILALLTVNIPGPFVSWLGNAAGGLDISLLAALNLAGLLYPIFLWLLPEPRGPRWVAAADLPIAATSIRRRLGAATYQAHQDRGRPE